MRVAVAGFGYWAPNLVRVATQLLGSDGVLVVETDIGRRASAEARFPGIATAADVATALTERAVGALLVCTPSATHFDLARRALEAGKSVFVEKPFVTSMDDARTLFRLARERGLVVFPGHIYLHTPFFRALKDVLGRDELGHLRYGVTLRASLGPRAREDVNAVWDYLIHDVYIFNALLGGAPLSVWARGGAYLRPGIEDVVFVTLEYPKQLLLNLYASWYAPERVRTMMLVGSEAMLDCDENRPEPIRVVARGYRSSAGTDRFGNEGLELFDDGVRAIPLDGGEEPLLREVRTFLACVRAGRPGPGIERHIAEVTATLQAIDRSLAARGLPTSVEFPDAFEW